MKSGVGNSGLRDLLRRAVSRALLESSSSANAWRGRWLHPDWLPGGLDRIYHFHVRKTGGTSVNRELLRAIAAFEWRDPGFDDDAGLYSQISAAKTRQIQVGRTLVVGWNHRALQKGAYHFGFSHHPAGKVPVFPNTLTMTVLRDPVTRLISHYNMLKDLMNSHNPRVDLQHEYVWVAETKNVMDFARRMPVADSHNQLATFSQRLNLNEAVDACSRMHLVLRTEELDHQGWTDLQSSLSKLQLRPRHLRASKSDIALSDGMLADLRSFLDQEYLFLERLERQRDGR